MIPSIFPPKAAAAFCFCCLLLLESCPLVASEAYKQCPGWPGPSDEGCCHPVLSSGLDPASAQATLNSELMTEDIGSGIATGYALSLSPDGSKLAVAEVGGSIKIISNPASDSPTVSTLISGLSGSHGACFSPDGLFVYATEAYANSLSKVRVSDGGKTTMVSSGLSGPRGCVASPNGEYVYVADHSNGRVVRISTSDNALASVGNVPGAYNVDVSTDGRSVYSAAYQGSGELYVFDTDNGNSRTTVATKAGSIAMAISHDAGWFAVVKYGAHTITAVSADGLHELNMDSGSSGCGSGTLAGTQVSAPTHVTFSHDGLEMYSVSQSCSTVKRYRRISSGACTTPIQIFKGDSNSQMASMLILGATINHLQSSSKEALVQHLLDNNHLFSASDGLRCFSSNPSVCFNVSVTDPAQCNLGS